MATFKRVEDIEAWKTTREIVRSVYSCSSAGPFARDFGLRHQLRRAAVSAMSNIAEGFERGGTAEFVQFLAIAKGSLGEVETQLYVAFDQRYVTPATLEALLQQTAAAKRMISGLMNYLRRCGHRGEKFKPPPNSKPETRN